MTDNITTIGENAFYNCEKLSSIILPQNLTKISGGAFESCSKIKILDIPSKVTTIGKLAFSNCSSLTVVNVYSTSLASVEDGAFTYMANNSVIFVKNYDAQTTVFNTKTYTSTKTTVSVMSNS